MLEDHAAFPSARSVTLGSRTYGVQAYKFNSDFWVTSGHLLCDGSCHPKIHPEVGRRSEYPTLTVYLDTRPVTQRWLATMLTALLGDDVIAVSRPRVRPSSPRSLS